MWTPSLVLLAVVVVSACVLVGGGWYEYRVIDQAWPYRPGIIQPRSGGIARRRFWVPSHTAFELLAVAAVFVTWNQPDVRLALLGSLVSHAVMRVWSLVDFVPKAIAFENSDPAVINQSEAKRWTSRSAMRLPLELVTAFAALAALVAAA